MRIAFIVQYCHRAGTFFRWHNLALGLQKAGHDVVVFAGDFDWRAESRIEYIDSIRYEISPVLFTSKIFLSPTDPITGFVRFFKIPKNFDVYHLFQPFVDGFLPWFLIKLVNKRARFFYDWDDLWTDQIITKEGGVRRWIAYQSVRFLEKVIPGISDGTTVCSLFLKELVSKNATLIYNGFWDFDNSSIEHRVGFVELRTGYKWKLVYTGRTNGELIWLSDLCATIERFNISVLLVICGPSQEQINLAGLNRFSNVQYLGVVSPEVARSVIASVDIGLLPMENTPFNQSRFPIKFFDYLSSGITVYCSEVGEIGKLGGRIDGVLLASHDQVKWVEGLVNLLMENNSFPKPLISKLSEQFSWVAATNKLEELYGV
ncbi:MAG: glycosyltransferase [Chitinophagaceae bacterium]|nr:glycosyltransferase [Chitinophagaceae bacterium]